MPVTPRRRQNFWSLTDPFVSFLFPPTCLSCKTPIALHSGGLCLRCHQALHCVHDGDAVYEQTRSFLTADGCLDRLVAPYYFEKEGPLQQLMHQLKYNGMTRIGTMMGMEIARGIVASAASGRTVIVPVPLHRSKLRERGYNQSYYLGKGMSRVLGVPVLPHAVRRAVYTRSQTTLDSAQRAKNVEGVFTLAGGPSSVLGGKTILLVDDVITTGATIRSCAMTLREADVAAIIACAAALAQ